jgi:hypothetical protein
VSTLDLLIKLAGIDIELSGELADEVTVSRR